MSRANKKLQDKLSRRADRKARKKEHESTRGKKKGRNNMFFDDEYYNAFHGTDFVNTYNRARTAKNNLNLVRSSASDQTASTSMSKEAQALVKQLLAKQARTYASYEDALADENPVPDSYFPGSTGWMVLQRRCIDGNEMQFVNEVKKNPLIDDVEKSSSIKIVNRIPKELLIEIVGSFARVCKASGNEAAAQIYRERTGDRKYVVYYPEQKISGAQVSYADDTGMIEMRVNHDLVMELHSHNTMAAFWSGTDDANEKDCGFYMVIGTFGAASASYKCRYKYGLSYQNFPAHLIFDMTPEEEVALLKRENWTEGNPIIDTKAKAHAVTYGSYRYDIGNYGKDYSYARSSYNYSKSKYDSLNSGKLPANLKNIYDQYKDKPITVAINKELSSAMWRYSKLNSDHKYQCENHVFTNDPANNVYGWIPIENMETENPLVTEVFPYVNNFVKEWNEHKLVTVGPASSPTPGSYAYNTSPQAVLEMLVGSSDDTQARQVSLPSKYKEYQNMSVPTYKPGINDDSFREAVEMQAIARATANENIESAYKEIVKTTEESYTPMTEMDFRKRLLGRINGEYIDTKFDPTIMWELFTTVDKSRLARTLGLTVVELSSMFGKLADTTLCYPFVIFIYWALLVSDDYRSNLMQLVQEQYDSLGITFTSPVTVNIIEKLNEVFNENPNIAIDITRRANAIPFKIEDVSTDVIVNSNNLETEEGDESGND